MSEEISEILIPTLVRGDQPVKMFFTWNEKNRTDCVHQRFVRHREPGDIVAKVNWRENPWFPEEANKLRQAFRRSYPNRYAHVWEGAPDDGDAESRVLPYAYLEAAMELWDKLQRGVIEQTPSVELRDAGLDIADGGANLNALVVRDGPLIEHVETWPSERTGYLKPTALRAVRRCVRDGVWRLYYDASCVGSPIRGELKELEYAGELGMYDLDVEGELRGWSGARARPGVCPSGPDDQAAALSGLLGDEA